MKGINGTFYQDDGRTMTVTADEGEVHMDSKDVVLTKNPHGVTSDGGDAVADKFTWINKDQTVVGEGNVRLKKDDTVATAKRQPSMLPWIRPNWKRMHTYRRENFNAESEKFAVLGLLAGLLSVSTACWAASSISGDQVQYDFKSGQAAAVGNVKIRHDDGTASAEEADYNTKTGEGKLTGSVVADQKDAHLTSSELIIRKKANSCPPLAMRCSGKRTRPSGPPRWITIPMPSLRKPSAPGPSSPWMTAPASILPT